MILRDHNLIFLHFPKTGGNTLSHLLLPFAEDRIERLAHQDGWDRFELVGPVTRTKHMSLGKYRDAMGAAALAAFRIAVTMRDPLDRAVSVYFSPHNWMVERGGRWAAVEPHFDYATFERHIRPMKTMEEFLTLDGIVVRPDFVLHFETLRADWLDMAARIGLPIDRDHWPWVNRSAAPDALRDAVRADPGVRRLVWKKFGADYALGGYPPPDDDVADLAARRDALLALA